MRDETRPYSRNKFRFAYNERTDRWNTEMSLQIHLTSLTYTSLWLNTNMIQNPFKTIETDITKRLLNLKRIYITNDIAIWIYEYIKIWENFQYDPTFKRQRKQIETPWKFQVNN